MIEQGVVSLNEGWSTKFAVWGHPEGAPVIHFHGSPGSRFERYADEAALASQGVRLITFDRPGYGAAPRLANWSVLRCADVVAALADHLKVERFHLHAFSAGAPYALATAFALGDRVRAIALLGGIGPLDRPGAFDGMPLDAVMEFAIARDEPHRLEAFLNERKAIPGLPADEYAAIEEVPGLLDMLLENHPETQRQGRAGVISDDLAIIANWGFSLDQIEPAIRLWHGDWDAVIPIHHAEFIAAKAKMAVLRPCPARGHFAMFGLQQRILADLLAVAMP